MAFIFHTLILITDNSIFLSLFGAYYYSSKNNMCKRLHGDALSSVGDISNFVENYRQWISKESLLRLNCLTTIRLL